MGRSKKKKQEEEVYQVEVITKARVDVDSSDGENEGSSSKKRSKKTKALQDGPTPATWKYLVKWAGYPSDSDSWEPEENLKGCHRLLSSFWAHVGTDDNDYPLGTTVEAKPDWIAKEKEYYRNQIKGGPGSDKSRKRKESLKDKGSKTPTPGPSEIASEPTSKPAKLVKATSPIEVDAESDDAPLIKIKKRKRTTVVVKHAIQSEDDEPEERPQKQRKGNSQAQVRLASTPKDRSMSPLFSAPSSAPSSPDIPLATLPAASASPTLPSKAQGSSSGSKLSHVVSTPPLPMHTKAAPPLPFRKGSHGRKPSNPHNQLADMPTSAVPTISGISTKQRLAQNALAPTNPKEIAAGSKHPKPRPQLSLSNLSFRKTSGSTMETDDHSHSITQLTRTASPAAGSASFPSLPPGAAMSPREPAPHSPLVPPLPPSLKRRPAQNSPIAPPEVVESFLQEAMPQELAAPLDPAPSQTEVAAPRALHPHPPTSAKLALPGRPLKSSWNWTGPLFLNEETTPACNLQIFNVAELKPTGMRFTVAFDRVERLRLSNVYEFAHIQRILDIYNAPPQIALVGPSEEEEQDQENFERVLYYMDRKRSVWLHPITLDDNVVGHILIFSPLSEYLLEHLQIPESHRVPMPTAFVAALLTYVLPPADTQVVDRSRLTKLPNFSPGPTVNEALFYQAASMIPLTKPFLEWLTRSEKSYSMWPSSPTNLETRYLRLFLESSSAKAAEYSVSVRAVFIHVSGLESFHTLNGLAARRNRNNEPTFYLYGSSSENPLFKNPIFREIYPCGGALTFTPSALMKDPFRMRQLIDQVGKHPLWVSYVLPAAVGMLAGICCPNGDALELFDRGSFPFEYFLKAIEEGQVALLQAPKKPRDAEWLANYASLRPPSARRALEIGIKAFERHSSIPQPNWVDSIEAEIKQDLLSMARQPAIIFNYRRYVIVRGPKENRSISAHGLEWTTPRDFDFGDEYFPKQTVGK